MSTASSGSRQTGFHRHRAGTGPDGELWIKWAGLVVAKPVSTGTGPDGELTPLVFLRRR